jgi:hypothetical protein
VGRGTVRWWVGKRPWWVVFRILTTLEGDWDQWFGQLTLTGIDPRRWDLHQLLAAYEATLQQGSKDEATWRRTRTQLYLEPSEVKKERMSRRPADRDKGARSSAMTLDSVEALLATASARDARFGAA